MDNSSPDDLFAEDRPRWLVIGPRTLTKDNAPALTKKLRALALATENKAVVWYEDWSGKSKNTVGFITMVTCETGTELGTIPHVSFSDLPTCNVVVGTGMRRHVQLGANPLGLKTFTEVMDYSPNLMLIMSTTDQMLEARYAYARLLVKNDPTRNFWMWDKNNIMARNNKRAGEKGVKGWMRIKPD